MPRAAPPLQGRYGFEGQPAVADCAEMVTRELLNALLWDASTQAFDASRLPASSLPALLDFYAAGGPADRDGAAAVATRKQAGDRGSGTIAGTSGAACGGPEPGWHAGPPVQTPAAEAWFGLVSNRKPIAYLVGLPSKRYEMAPTVENVATCLGVLMGVTAEVRSPEALGELWRRIQPERKVAIRTNPRRDRMYLLECGGAGSSGGSSGSCSGSSCGGGGGGGGGSSSSGSSGSRGGGGAHDGATESELVVSVEFVMSERLNHAFAIHHWQPPPWQREAALLASASRCDLWWASCWASPPASSPPSLPRAALPRAALLPALLTPILSEAAADAGAEAATAASPRVPRQLRPAHERRWQRLLLLSCDPSDSAAVATNLLALLECTAAGEQRPPNEDDLLDEMLAARVLALSGGFPGATDELLLRLAVLVAKRDSAALRRAALLEGPLAAPLALLCAKQRGAEGAGAAIASWGRAASASLGDFRQALRCTVRAALLRPQ